MQVHTVHIPAHVSLQIQQNVTGHLLGYCEEDIAYVNQFCPSVPPGQNTSSAQFQQVYLSYLASTNGHGIPVGWSLNGELIDQASQFHKQLDQAIFGAVLVQYKDDRLMAFDGEMNPIKIIVTSNPLLSNYILNEKNSLLSYTKTENHQRLLTAIKK